MRYGSVWLHSSTTRRLCRRRRCLPHPHLRLPLLLCTRPPPPPRGASWRRVNDVVLLTMIRIADGKVCSMFCWRNRQFPVVKRRRTDSRPTNGSTDGQDYRQLDVWFLLTLIICTAMHWVGAGRPKGQRIKKAERYTKASRIADIR